LPICHLTEFFSSRELFEDNNMKVLECDVLVKRKSNTDSYTKFYYYFLSSTSSICCLSMNENVSLLAKDTYGFVHVDMTEGFPAVEKVIGMLLFLIEYYYI